ncbi:MAG: F0F1 ATP synthase subunit delta [Planctomycetia bacterium]|nr:F0F1 ATP synthase subunit delta [Planctomycetia bacterium]
MTFNLWTFLLQVFNFLVLAYVLHRLLYHPLREAIDRRRQAHEQAQAAAEKASSEARELQKRLESELAELDHRRQETLRQAQEQALSERQRLLDTADLAVRQKQEAAKAALVREREETLAALNAEIIEQAVGLSRRMLAEAADLSLDVQLAGRLVESLRQLPPEERDELRRTWQPRDMAVLETAADLNGSRPVAEITAAAGEILGREVTLQVQRRESLLGGVRLRLGGRVWDASLAGQLPGPSAAGARGTDHA